MDVIHRRWYVINPKEETYKAYALITYSSQGELITYAYRRLHTNPSDWIKIRQSIDCLIFWRHHPDLNRGIKVLQTSALPLGYGALYGADYGARTRHLDLGKVALYQMS